MRSGQKEFSNASDLTLYYEDMDLNRFPVETIVLGPLNLPSLLRGIDHD